MYIEYFVRKSELSRFCKSFISFWLVCELITLYVHLKWINLITDWCICFFRGLFLHIRFDSYLVATEETYKRTSHCNPKRKKNIFQYYNMYIIAHFTLKCWINMDVERFHLVVGVNKLKCVENVINWQGITSALKCM